MEPAAAFVAAAGAAVLIIRSRRTFSGEACIPEPWKDGVGSDGSGAPVLLALDIGSSSVKVTAFAVPAAGDGRRHALITTREAVAMRSDGSFVAQELVAACETAVSGCIAGARAAAQRILGDAAVRVVAVGAACFAMSFLGVDGDDAPCTPVFSYAGRSPGLETSTSALRAAMGDDAAASRSRTGCPIHASYFPAQFFHETRRGDDDVRCARVERARRWTTVVSYLFARWRGCAVDEVPVSFSEASWTGMLDWRAMRWDEGVVGAAGLSMEALPSLADVNAGLRGVSATTAARWPELDSDVQLFLAVGDGAAATIGSHCFDERRVCMTVGTSAAARVVLEVNKEILRTGDGPGTGLWIYRVDSRRVLVGGALTDGGSLVAWMRDLLSDARASAALEGAQQLEPDSHGLTVLPFLSGERSTGWQAAARGTLTGVTRETAAHHVARAVVESVALRIAAVVGALRPLVDEHAVIVAGGGAVAATPWWSQVIADACGRQVVVADATPAGGASARSGVAETTSEGIAELALEQLFPDSVSRTSHSMESGQLLEPRAAYTAIYDAARARQEKLHSALSPHYAALAGSHGSR